MSCSDVITLLKNQGCLDLTTQINSSKCPKLLSLVSIGGTTEIFSGSLNGDTLVAIKKVKTNHDQQMQARVYDESTLICAGLAYLHDRNIIHGSLKGSNVLISQDGTPMLMDFGMARLQLLIPQTITRPKYLLRWTPLEIYEEKSSYTLSGDIYSLGMTILEAFTSQVPFADLTDNLLVMHVAVSRNIPTRPKTIPMNSIDGDRVWEILKKCWSYNPRNRPSAEAVQSEIDPKMDHQSSEEVQSGIETLISKNPDPEEHLGAAVDWSKMEPITAQNLNPMDQPSTGVVLDKMETVRAKNLDAVGSLSSEAVGDKVKTIRPEHSKKAGGTWRKLFSKGGNKGNN
ncbi:unnamed protein product [Rhizoctonia solani]|uniref:Protein kinase domain-containing protein n=1 Tax=Rhizoctonia solani TaxID=456999 RepID=A0A8H3HS18_9AGAM|nr:unnamed protein product [Rhizoctonia solani]